MGKSVTVIIPALNEADNIVASYEKTKEALRKLNLDHEIILVNDGSEDKTGEIIEFLGSKDPKIKTIHHSSPKGMGVAYKTAIELSQKTSLLLMPGDDDLETSELMKILEAQDDNDIVVPYIDNVKNRPVKRRFFSQLFTKLINFLFNMDLKYYNGPVLHLTENLKGLNIKSDRYTYQAEILIKLVKLRKCSITHIGILSNERRPGESKAVKPSNFIDVARFLTRMFFEESRT